LEKDRKGNAKSRKTKFKLKKVVGVRSLYKRRGGMAKITTKRGPAGGRGTEESPKKVPTRDHPRGAHKEQGITLGVRAVWGGAGWQKRRHGWKKGKNCPGGPNPGRKKTFDWEIGGKEGNVS